MSDYLEENGIRFTSLQGSCVICGTEHTRSIDRLRCRKLIKLHKRAQTAFVRARIATVRERIRQDHKEQIEMEVQNVDFGD